MLNRTEMMSSIEDKNQIVKKLSNYLKLPKAQRWISCEWFYSDIDKVIFESENDFQFCLKQSFPRLKTNKLRRKEWCILRTLIGKPRRCSDAFFREERLMLEEKRQKIRLIQQRKVSDKELIDFKDLPQEIPLTLSIGHRVYSHISYPEEGVFLGTIAAVDPCEHTYRVVFDRLSIGSQTVYDYEIKSVTPVQTIPIKAYLQTYRPKITASTQSSQSLMLTPHKSLLTPNNQLDDLSSININNPAFAASLLLQSDPMIGISSPFKLGLDCLSGLNSQFQTPLVNSSGIISNSIPLNGGLLGGFPIRLLVMITRLNKILNIKREYVSKLNNLNTEAEKLRANNEPITKEFQTQYAILVLDLDKLNKDLSDYLNGVQRFCEDLAPGEFSRLQSICSPNETIKIEDFKQKIDHNSKQLVERLNCKHIDTTQIEDEMNRIDLNDKSKRRIKSKHLIELITKMTSLLFQIREFVHTTNKSTSSQTFLPNCTRLINETISDIKNNFLKDSNIDLFVDKIQIHINHIQSTLCQYTKLHAFKYESDLNNMLTNETDTLIECISDDLDDFDDDDDVNDYDLETDSENYLDDTYSNENKLKLRLKRKRLDLRKELCSLSPSSSSTSSNLSNTNCLNNQSKKLNIGIST